MSHSENHVIVHIVFSTKRRYPFIHKGIRNRLHAYQSVIVRSQKCQAYRVGGIADHVHLAVGLVSRRLNSTKKERIPIF